MGRTYQREVSILQEQLLTDVEFLNQIVRLRDTFGLKNAGEKDGNNLGILKVPG